MYTLYILFKVVWISPSSVALTLDDRRITDDARYFVERPFSQEWNLNIMNVTHQDAGQYRCQVNTVPVTSKTVNLAVLGKIISIKPSLNVLYFPTEYNLNLMGLIVSYLKV
jgi:hypothetical protein